MQIKKILCLTQHCGFKNIFVFAESTQADRLMNVRPHGVLSSPVVADTVRYAA